MVFYWSDDPVRSRFIISCMFFYSEKEFAEFRIIGQLRCVIVWQLKLFKQFSFDILLHGWHLGANGFYGFIADKKRREVWLGEIPVVVFIFLDADGIGGTI